MKPLIRVNIAAIATFAIVVVAASLYIRDLTQNNALQNVTQQAELLLEQAKAVRSYTVKEVRPLTKLSGDGYSEFHPQSVPAYAAAQVNNLFRQKRPEYSYKEAVFNPTNTRNNAAPWEESVIQQFIKDPSLKKIVGKRYVDRKKSLYIAHPIKITNPDCLECHSTPEAAPASMVTQYGEVNGFGWKLGEVVGTQMVLVPYALPEKIANMTLMTFLSIISLAFFALMLSINLVLWRQ